uniref:Uncharacterized protein n=1 Tax=Odontella aurita TaxID=265563 RepID=A0A7S4MU71_9STRA|mmetsp:Transcript_33005/g.98219  ORF Transcript_33005/g.98219 Transcript_33005/m.98219 type:complete len:125 (+) Transcript_33005:2-376(+)
MSFSTLHIKACKDSMSFSSNSQMAYSSSSLQYSAPGLLETSASSIEMSASELQKSSISSMEASTSELRAGLSKAKIAESNEADNVEAMENITEEDMYQASGASDSDNNEGHKKRSLNAINISEV